MMMFKEEAMRKNNQPLPWVILSLILVITLLSSAAMANARNPLPQADNPNPPGSVVKLIFIHHSSGENWLADGNGRLGKTLGENNYFVSDTNYGWGPDSIGDRTDIPNWLEWFRSANTNTYMTALYNESGKHSSYTRTLANPGGQNEIVMFKSCFPNSALAGHPNDPPKVGTELTVGNVKYIYNELLQYFYTQPDKLFVVITAPPLRDPTYAANARAFNNWLVNGWLDENNYPYPNVAVFDFYNVLTGPDNHHRFIISTGLVQHVYTAGMNTSYYHEPGDDHPSAAGNRKAKNEFIPLLNVYYHRWKAGTPSLTKVTAAIKSTGSHDGWVRESNENSNAGGSINSTAATFNLGDDSQNRQYRGILSFDTATLPDNAWIVSAVLKIKRQGMVGTNPFNTHQNLYVDIRKPYFGAAATLAAGDFQAAASRNMVGKFNSTPSNWWYSATLNSTAFQWFKLTGPTQMRLRFQLDDDDDGVADYLSFFSGDEATTSDRPVLTIQYYIP